MFTLIKREIEQNIILFAIAALYAAIFIGTIVVSVIERQAHSSSPMGISNTMMLALVFYLPLTLSLLSAITGLVQMYTDRDKKLSAFLSTLATTRIHILLARIFTGVLTILTVLLPVVAASAILLQLFHPAPVSGIYTAFFMRVFAVTFLLALACYCIGLQIGWNRGIVITITTALFLTIALFSLLIIKGFGLEGCLILAVIIVASLARTWRKFISTSL